MPSIKKHSTGDLGNIHPDHLNTDHINTHGLDPDGLPGIETYIDEDLVRAYDDSRPINNLLSNDGILNVSIDDTAKSLSTNAYLKNSDSDWQLSIDSLGYYSDPENLKSRIQITPLKVSTGSAYSAQGIITNSAKKLSGFKRDDDSFLWLDEHDWNYGSDITVNDTATTYEGYYRPVYVDVHESTLPSDYADYTLNLKQATSTGNIYSYSIYTTGETVIPFAATGETISGEEVDFTSAQYPYYDLYPDSYISYQAGGAGEVNISSDAQVVKNLKKQEVKIIATEFSGSPSGAELKSSEFRESLSANVNRIENDANFVKSMVGVKADNGFSKVYFRDFKDASGVLQPLKDNRHFLGNQDLSFELAIVKNPGDQDLESDGFYYLNGEDSTAYSFRTASGEPSGGTIAQSRERPFKGTYSTKVDFTSKTSNNWVVGDLNYHSDYASGPGTGIVFVRTAIYIPSSFNFDTITYDYNWLLAIGETDGNQPIITSDAIIHFGVSSTVAGGTEVPTRWVAEVDGVAAQYSTENFSLDEWHIIELYFKEDASTGGGAVWVDGTLIYENFAQNYSSKEANGVYIGTGYGVATTVAPINIGSFYYLDDIRADRFRITEDDDKYKAVTLTSPETRGYQNWDINKADPTAGLSIANNTYNFKISVNNDTQTNVAVAVITTDSLNDIKDKINAQFVSNSIYAYAHTYDSGTNAWDIKIYSKSSGSYSSIATVIGDSNDLIVAALGGSIDSAVTGISDWEIHNSVTPGLTIAQFGGANGFSDPTIGYRLYNAIDEAKFEDYIVGIDTATSSNHTCELYIQDDDITPTQGYQELGMSITNTALDTNLTAFTDYYFKLNLNGEGLTEYKITTTVDTTYAGLIVTINNTLLGVAVMSIEAGDVRITSDSYGAQSSVLTADGTTGTSLFGAAYPGGGFKPSASHETPVVGTGKSVYIRPRKITSFAIFEDSVAERVVYTHGDTILHVTPDTNTDTRDYVDTEFAFDTGTSVNRWSTHNDRVNQVDLSNHASWSDGAFISKVATITANSDQYLLVGNTFGQVFYYLDDKDIYIDALDSDDFTLFTDTDLGTNWEKVNNFYVFDDTHNHLFILTDSFIYHTDLTGALSASQAFTAIDTSDSVDVPNVSAKMFSEIRDAQRWEIDVDATHTNKYIIFVGKSVRYNSWDYAPILYGLYDDAAYTFDWYADEIYKKDQIDDITSIVEYVGWADSEQSSQIFLSSNINGPEIWAGNSLNNWQDIGGAGDDRFNRFSWTEPNYESGKNALSIDDEVTRINTLSIFDSKIYNSGIRMAEDYSGHYSYGLSNMQKTFAIDTVTSLVSTDNQKLYSSVYRSSGPNSDPAILVTSEELDDGRAQVISERKLESCSGWAADCAFRATLVGFNVGGVSYDAEYTVTFNASTAANIDDIITAINTGFSTAAKTGAGSVDLAPVIRARKLDGYEKSETDYIPIYKISIESKTADTGESGGHTNTEETTQSDCSITIDAPLNGTSVVGTGVGTMEITASTIAYSNLQLVDWASAKVSLVNRVSSPQLSFSGNTYVNITSLITSGYDILTGSFRVKSNATDEIGFSGGAGRIIASGDAVSLNSETYTFEVQFNENFTAAGAQEVTPVTCVADVSGNLSGKYWLLNSPTEYYYIWYDVDSGSTDPAISGRVGIEVDISTNDSANTVAGNTRTVINNLNDFSAPATGYPTVTITNAAIGNAKDANAGNSGFTIGSITQGAKSAPIKNLVEIDGGTITSFTTLIAAINADLSVATASLQQIASTGEYCDIVIETDNTGDDYSVEIRPAIYGTYLFGITGIDTALNTPIAGSTGLTTPGSQTLGYTWENADYFIEYNYTGPQVRIYIPNGTTRLTTGSSVYVDFWQYKELTKIAAGGSPTGDEWTYDINAKKILLGTAPSTSPEDIIFADIKVEKIIRTLGTGTSVYSDQEDISNELHFSVPNKLSNSDILITNSLARLSALNYGSLIVGTDTDDPYTSDYTYSVPRIDVLSINHTQDEYGSRVRFVKGQSDAKVSWVDLPLNNNASYIYSAMASSRDYEKSRIVRAPWYLSDNISRNSISIDGNTQYFKTSNDMVSTRGLTSVRGSADISKIALSGDYALVKITEPVGVLHRRKRQSAYEGVDASQTIFVDTILGNDANSGFDKHNAILTVQAGINAATSARPYVYIMMPVDESSVSITGTLTINDNFKIYLIAQGIATTTYLITAKKECYIEGIKSTVALQAEEEENVTVKYCEFLEVTGDSAGASTSAGHHIEIYNSVIREGFTTATEVMTGDFYILFDHVYVPDSANLLTFDTTTYETTGSNQFIFNNVTNKLNGTEKIVTCGKTSGILIEFNNCLFVSETSEDTAFDSDATITITNSIGYQVENAGTAIISTNNYQAVTSGEIDIITITGAQKSIARGYATDSLALNYVDRRNDVGAFLEERIAATIEDEEEYSRDKSFLNFKDLRVQYRYNIYSDKFSFYMRFKPLENYTTTGVLFDSRSDDDFTSTGVFNTNAIDFIQVVYDNKTYERNELTVLDYTFKVIISNGSTVSGAVIGPRFNSADNSEYQQWHEISILLDYRDTYNNKYNLADLSNGDRERKQLLIYTTFDRDFDRIYAAKNPPYENSSKIDLVNSKWHPGEIVSRFFNVGGGWASTWNDTFWSPWAPITYSMAVDDFVLSSDVIPVNILRDFGAKVKIDEKENDYRVPRYDDKNAGIILHCDNPHPFSENGLQPEDDVNISFRQYEGFESHGISVSEASQNILDEGRITKGNWIERAAAKIFDSTATDWEIWAATSGLDGDLVSIVAENTAGDLYLKFVDPATGTVDSSNLIGSTISPTEVVAKAFGSSIVVGYVDSSTFLKIITWNGSSFDGPFTITSTATTYISVCRGHSDSQAAFSYRTPSLGRAKIVNVTSGADIVAEDDFTIVDIKESAIVETKDENGNDTYTFFYRVTSSDNLDYIMYNSTLTSSVFTAETLNTPVGAEVPTNIKADALFSSKFIVKWNDWTTAADSPTKIAYVANTGDILTQPIAVFSATSPDSFSDDYTVMRDSKVLVAGKDRTSNDIKFKLYKDDNSILTVISNSTYFRDFDELTPITTHVATPVTNSIGLVTSVTDALTNDNGVIVAVESDVPTRWFKDFTGVYDTFDVSADETKTLYGLAYHQRFDHVINLGESGPEFVADAEGDIGIWDVKTEAGTGTITETTAAAIHQTYGYEFSYDGTNRNLSLEENAISSTPNAYARFYLRLGTFFGLTSGTQLEIARMRTNAGTTDLWLLLEFNSADGKYKIVANTTSGTYGTDTSSSSVIQYNTNHYIEMRYYIASGSAGGWEVWVDGVSVISDYNYDSSGETGVTDFRIGSDATDSTGIPTSDSKLYFDSIKVAAAPIGEYIAGLGQGEIWQEHTVATNDHFISFYYWTISGSWILKLEGAALNEVIEFEFTDDELNPYIHTTQGSDSVTYIDNYSVNFNKIRKHIIKFTPDTGASLKVRLMSTNSSTGVIDDFYVDNIKVEENTNPTPIESDIVGYIEYPYAMKLRGSAFLRVIPEIFDADTTNRYLFAAYATDATDSDYISHSLYFDNSAKTFKFSLKDIDAHEVIIESDAYGLASSARQLTDLREKHNIVCNWDLDANYMEFWIDNLRYSSALTALTGVFASSKNVLVGNNSTKNVAANTIFDLIRFGEEPFGFQQVEDFSRKRDPFLHRNKTNIGSVNVRGLSFFGLTSTDQFDQTIYTEMIDSDSWRLVIDKGVDHESEVTIRYDGTDIVTFGTTGAVFDGSVTVGTLIATTTDIQSTTSDTVTLRWNVPTAGDGHFAVSRGAGPSDATIDWDESQESWVFNNASDNVISIDDVSIGSWNTNEDFNLVADGSGAVIISTDTTTSAGTATRTIEAADERASFDSTEIVFNDPGSDLDFRVESVSDTHMLFVDGNADLVTTGRSTGTIPAQAITDHPSISLGVDEVVAVVSNATTHYGAIAFYDNAGTANEAGYIGIGDADAGTPYWEIKTVDANYLSISGGDVVVDNATTGIAFSADITNSRFDYIADASTFTGSNTLHGIACEGSFAAYKIYNGVWNDLAEAFEFNKEVESNPKPGFIYKMTENGIIKTEARAEKATVGVHSDTYGQLMGSHGLYDDAHPDGNKLPIGLAGKVSVWVKEAIEIGDSLVSDVNGFATKATDEERRYSDLTIGKALESSQDNEEKRIWVLIK